MSSEGPRGPGAAVEFYAGSRGGETPRAVTIDGLRFEVRSILARERVLDAATGSVRDVWRCRLDDGRVAVVEFSEGGAGRVTFPG